LQDFRKAAAMQATAISTDSGFEDVAASALAHATLCEEHYIWSGLYKLIPFLITD
jgi:hypothetical protein